jgi:Flp pilus assembly protein TadG
MQRFIRALRAHRKGVVALWVAVSAPVLMASVGLGIQAAQMAVTRAELQVATDAAAVAGALALGSSGSVEVGANAAADVAEVNGVAGTASRVWDTGNKILSDGNVTVTIGIGVTSSTYTAVTVTASRSINGAFAMLVGGSATATISATSTADSMPGNTGGQPCLLALGTTSSAITMSGSTQVTGHNCTIRSNGGITMSGSGTIDVPAIYAGGAITRTGSFNISGDQNPNSGTITDPFPNYAPLQSALATLSPGSGGRFQLSGSNGGTISPGTYSSINVSGSGNLTMSPGLYVINGDISFSGSGKLIGSGVTIISSGSIQISGSSSVELSAPDASATSGGVPGVLYASTTTRANAVSGSTGMPVSGLIYTPHAALTFTGSSAINGCTELVAWTITMTGSSSTEANCATYGLPSYGSVPGSSSARLVR